VPFRTVPRPPIAAIAALICVATYADEVPPYCEETVRRLNTDVLGGAPECHEDEWRTYSVLYLDENGRVRKSETASVEGNSEYTRKCAQRITTMIIRVTYFSKPLKPCRIELEANLKASGTYLIRYHPHAYVSPPN
jgi:hypothetical protein